MARLSLPRRADGRARKKERRVIQKISRSLWVKSHGNGFFCWLGLAYLTPVFFLPWTLIAFLLHALGLPKIISIFLALIPALVGLCIHMQWRG